MMPDRRALSPLSSAARRDKESARAAFSTGQVAHSARGFQDVALRGRLAFHGPFAFGRYFAELSHRQEDAVGGFALFYGRFAHALTHRRDGPSALHDGFQGLGRALARLPRARGKGDARLGAGRRYGHALSDLVHAGADLAMASTEFSASLRISCATTAKPFPASRRARALDRRVQGQELGSSGYVVDGLDRFLYELRPLSYEGYAGSEVLYRRTHLRRS
jgi:hypothetical protein